MRSTGPRGRTSGCQEDQRKEPAEIQADTGCCAAAVQADTAVHDSQLAIVPVVTQANVGCHASGDVSRHGLSCRLRCGQTRAVAPTAIQADTGCRAGEDAGRHGLSCWWRCKQTRVVRPMEMQAGTGCRACADAGGNGLSRHQAAGDRVQYRGDKARAR